VGMYSSLLQLSYNAKCSQPFYQPFDLTTIRAPDGSITAKFVSLGATLTELWVKDRAGKPRDVVLGYDDNVCPNFSSTVLPFLNIFILQSQLLTDPDHPVFNAIVGRYANRIKNGLQFSLVSLERTFIAT
jgi:aldose 1-epimerase